jgi:hypothetical protein
MNTPPGPEKKPVNNVLQSPAVSVANAYSEVLVQLMNMLEEISDSLAELSGCANVIATFLERKGIEEGIFSPEDIKDMRTGEDEEKKKDEEGFDS